MNNKNNERVFNMSFASVYPHYIAKAEKKGRTKEEVDHIISWLTGYNLEQVNYHLENKTTLRDFFENATLNENASKITGVICGYRVEEIDDQLMQKIRYLDKLVDELSKGKAMQKILRIKIAIFMKSNFIQVSNYYITKKIGKFYQIHNLSF